MLGAEQHKAETCVAKDHKDPHCTLKTKPQHWHWIRAPKESVLSALGFNKPSDFWPLKPYWGDILGG